jgi:histidinol-phosphatase (PHP family)
MNESNEKLTRLYDMHSHTKRSADSNADINSVAEAARALGLCGFAVTDHYNVADGEDDEVARISASARDAKAAAIKYSGTMEILAGIEIGESIYSAEKTRAALDCAEFDVVLASVHCPLFEGRHVRMHTEDFSALTTAKIHEFIENYFDECLKTVSSQNCDVFAHLTLPFRYVNSKYKLGIDIKPYMSLIDEILRVMINRSIALEINTSGFESGGFFMPDRKVIERYKELGGELVTLGSDAHTPERIGSGLFSGAALLREVGFTHCYYFKKRKPVPYLL